MASKSVFLFAAAVALSSGTASAQSTGFADPASIDAEVVAFTGAAIGTPGGARQQVDRRLRLARCGMPLSLSWHGRSADMVRVACPEGSGWQIFVPVVAGATSAAQAAPAAAPVTVVERGQILTITIAGEGFSVSQQGEALDDGAIGNWIRIRPEGNREPVRAQILTPQRAVIPLG